MTLELPTLPTSVMLSAESSRNRFNAGTSSAARIGPTAMPCAPTALRVALAASCGRQLIRKEAGPGKGAGWGARHEGSGGERPSQMGVALLALSAHQAAHAELREECGPSCGGTCAGGVVSSPAVSLRSTAALLCGPRMAEPGQLASRIHETRRSRLSGAL